MNYSFNNCPQELRELAYMSMIISQLEYIYVVWDSYQIKDISNIENVQWKAIMSYGNGIYQLRLLKMQQCMAGKAYKIEDKI